MRQLTDSTWVLEGPANIGFIVREGKATLIDSGNDKEAGRRINKILKEQNWELEAVVNTHSNADHIGGNDYLQRNLNCRIYAPSLENYFIESPELEAAFLWGGKEVKELRNKFFQAKASRVDRIIEMDTEFAGGLQAFPLKGHFFNMAGIRTPDGVLFLADCLFGKEILGKYGIPFIFDVGQFKETIEAVKDMEADWYIPSHSPVLENIEETAELNLELVEKIEGDILGILMEEKSFDQILKELCDRYRIKLNPGQYALIASTLRSFLSYLYDEDLAAFVFQENRMLWKSR